MKKFIITIGIILIGLASFGQPITSGSGPSFTVQDARKMFQYNMFLPRFADTTAANLQKGIDSCGALIFTYDISALWYRACNGYSSRVWIQVLPAGSPSGLTGWLVGGNTLGTVDPDSATIGSINSRNVYFISTDTKRFALHRDGIQANTSDVLNLGVNTVTGMISYGVTPSSTGWGILGNAGTTAGTNFVGTTDAQDLVLKANSFEMMRLDQNYYNISIGYLGLPSTNAPTASVPNIAIGTQSMRNATTAYGNTAIGNESLNVLTTQQGNIAMGHQSGATATGIYGTYLGTHSGQNNTTGDYNVGIGYYSVFAAAGSNNTGAGTRTLQSSRTGNTALGFWALNGNGTGGAGTGAFLADYNVGIGYQAGLTIGANTYNVLVGALTASSDGLTNAGAIGAYASVTQANSISIGSINGTNGATVTAKIGIGTTAPSQLLSLGTAGSIAGIYSIAGSTSGIITLQPQAAAGTFNWNWPITAGTSGQVLTSGGGSSTAMTWTTPATGTVGTVSFTGGLISVANPTTSPALTVAGTSGGGVYFSSTSTWASTGLLAANAIMIGGGAGTAYSTTTTGANVLTALGVAVGSAGAFVVNGGALGTPSSGTVTNLTGTASININGTVGATTPAAGTFTSLAATSPAFTTSITTPSTTFALVNTTATTVNFAGAATTLNMMASAGVLNFGGGVTVADFRFLEGSGGGTNYVGFKANATLAGNTVYTLPIAFPAGNNYLLNSSTAGVLGFTDPSTFATSSSVTAAIAAAITAGTYTDAGAGPTYTVTMGVTQPNTTYKVFVTPSTVLTATAFWVENKTTTTFDVTFSAGILGGVTFDWAAIQL